MHRASSDVNDYFARRVVLRWRLLPRADQERVVELIEDDREDEAMEVLGMKMEEWKS
jgi:hypothetical protein